MCIHFIEKPSVSRIVFKLNKLYSQFLKKDEELKQCLLNKNKKQRIDELIKIQKVAQQNKNQFRTYFTFIYKKQSLQEHLKILPIKKGLRRAIFINKSVIKMQNQLNYYSRYNRIKVQDKKEIPSLYSLLSYQTLTKLAHDASVSLQMISLYKKEKLYHSVAGDHETEQSEYLQANNLFTFRSFQSQSVDRKKSRNKKAKQSVHVTKKKTKLNPRNEQQKLQKQAYLQSLVREVRSKSIERLQGNSLPKEQMKRNKKSKKKSMIQLKEKIHRQTYHNVFKDNLNNSQEDQQIQNNHPQMNEKKIHKKFIKSLVSDEEKSVKQSIEKSKIEENDKSARKQYVESIDDENQKQLSGPSIVLERLNFKVSDTHPLIFKDQIKERMINKKFESQSKQDNPSSNDVKQSEIKSFSKEIQILKRPFKNLIELQLNHSQSQIWQPEERSLQIPYRQFQVSRDYQAQKRDQNPINQHKNQVQPDNIFTFEYQREDQQNISPRPHILFQIHSEIEQLDESKDKVNYLSQINQQKQVQQPPYQHPLQNLKNQLKFIGQQINPGSSAKRSFKKFILNKQLNARLVTSTILNERNQRYSNLQKQKPKFQTDENLKQKMEFPFEPLKQKSQKVNFKALIKKKKQASSKQENLPQKNQKPIPFRKLQNQKLLQAFFNIN